MRIVLWVGNKANQKALANKIHAQFPIAGIITESRAQKEKLTIKYLSTKIIEKLFLGSIAKAWHQLKHHYDKKYPHFPAVEMLDVENINSSAAYEFTQKLQPDLIIVSGTRLVKEKMLAIKPTVGILNLHTGLSPYIKGGPNCTNWCIATQQYHLIGNTIMWIDAGIDSGNIFTTAFTTFDGNENLSETHIKVMEHAHDLYVKVIEALHNNTSQSVAQDTITKGKTFYTRDWTLMNKIKLVLHFKKFKQYFKAGKQNSDRKNIRIVPLNINKK